MSLGPESDQDLAALPPALRELLAAELAAGNTVVEIGHSFPAPPAGAYFKLSRPVSTRPRASSGGVVFYDRNGSLYSGEFTDEKRFYFLLEPPHPPLPEPDMDAIRAAGAAQQGGRASPRDAAELAPTIPAHGAAPAPPPSGAPGSAAERFRRSMAIDYGKWHDGIGYDVGILTSASAEERAQIEQLLLEHGVEEWRDVEALAALDSPRARLALQEAFASGGHRVRIAVIEHAPHLVTEPGRIAALIDAIEHAEVYGGLTQALLQVERFHPPPVVDALFRGVLARDGETAVHFAAMLMFLHGKATSAFDLAQRPYFLRFHTEDRAAREAMLQDLCRRVGVAAERFVRRGGR